MRGKPSASTLLRKEGELVRWSVDGGQFVVQSENMIDIYRTVWAATYCATDGWLITGFLLGYDNYTNDIPPLTSSRCPFRKASFNQTTQRYARPSLCRRGG